MGWVEHAHAGRDALAEALAARLERLTRAALRARGRAVLALAGGETPLPAYRRLATATLEWRRVTVVPTDERWVAHTHAASNIGALADVFEAAAGIDLRPLSPSLPFTPASAALACATLQALPDAFDVVLLGIGADAHTASLFADTAPGSTPLAAALHPRADDALVITPAAAPHERITLSAPRLLRTRAALLALCGHDKRRALRAAQSPAADPGQLPIAALLHAPGPDIEIHWSP